MKNTNIGIANLIISNKLKNSYFDNKLIDESKKIAFDFFDVVKNSPLLQLEFKVFDNIENKSIENDLIATRYIDNNIKLFEIYTLEDIESERSKLKSFIDESIVSNTDDRYKLYEAIDILIKESVSDNNNVNVDVMHESFVYVLNHIKKPKTSEISTIDDDINEEVIEIAVNKFNNKYDSLNEDDKNLLKKLINSSDYEKESILEEYKIENLKILEGIGDYNSNTKIINAIQKIKDITYNINNVDDNIIKLYELKKELL